MGGSGTIDRAFFELNSNAKDVDQGFKNLIKTVAGTNDEVKRAQKSVLDLTNANKDLTNQLTTLDTKNKALSESIKNGSLNTTQATAARKELQSVLKEQENVENKYIQNQKKLADAHSNLDAAVKKSGGSFQAFGQIVSDFATNPINSMQRGMTALVTSMGPVAVGISAIGAAAVTAAVGLFSIVNATTEAAEQIQNLSNATGMSVEQIQALQRLGKERGLGDLTGAIERLNAQLGSDKGGEFTEAILKANIAAKQGQGAIFYLEEMRKKYAEVAAARGKDAAAQQAAADLGPRLIRQFGPLILDPERSITGTLQEIQGSWAIINAAEIAHQNAVKEKIELVDRRFEGVKNKLKELAVFWFDYQTYGLLDNKPSPIATTAAQMSAHSGTATSSMGINELARRSNIIAQADAIAAGTKRELVGLTSQLNELQRQYSEEKGKEKSLTQFDEKKIFNLSSQIDHVKDLIKEQEELIKTEQRLANFDRYNAPRRDPFFRLEGADNTEGINMTPSSKGGELLNLPAPTPGRDMAEFMLDKDKIKTSVEHLSPIWDSMGSQIANGISTGFKDGFGFAKNMAQMFIRDVVESVWSKSIGSYLSKNIGGALSRGGLVAGGSVGALNSASNGFGIAGAGQWDAQTSISAFGSIIPETAGTWTSWSGTFGNSQAAQAGQAGAAIAGSWLLSDAWKQGGARGAAEGALGGASLGMAIGGPIGAIVGAIGGSIFGALGGGEQRREKERKGRIIAQESKLFTALDAIDRVESYESGADIEAIVSITGREILYSTLLKEQILTTVNRAIISGGNQLSDNIAWAGNR
jgi:hypothetical protein